MQSKPYVVPLTLLLLAACPNSAIDVGSLGTGYGAVSGGSSDGAAGAMGPRKLDSVFMIDDSPSMAPKQAKLKVHFPKLITALQDPNTGALPDLRIAIIDSDLGAGGRWSPAETTNCIPDSANNNNIWGDEGHFQMVGAASLWRDRSQCDMARTAPIGGTPTSPAPYARCVRVPGDQPGHQWLRRRAPNRSLRAGLGLDGSR